MSKTRALFVLDGAVPRLGVTFTDRPETVGNSPSIRSPKPSRPPRSRPSRFRPGRTRLESHVASLVASRASRRPKASRKSVRPADVGSEANTRLASVAHARRSPMKARSKPSVPGTQPSQRTIRSSSAQESRWSRSKLGSVERLGSAISSWLRKAWPRPLKVPTAQIPPEGRPRIPERSNDGRLARTSVMPSTSPSVRPSHGISMSQRSEVLR